MGLPHGCLSVADRLFETKFGVKITSSTDGQRQTQIQLLNSYEFFVITPMYGDCTACTLYQENISLHRVEAMLDLLIKYMSINARISCFFSRKVSKEELPTLIEILKKFHIVGRHIQHSNRTESEYYMVSGIIKIPTPHVCRNYDKYDREFDEKHNMFDLKEFNEINRRFATEQL